MYLAAGGSTMTGSEAEDFKATYVRYKKVRRDWINGGGTAGDWPFSGPMLDEEAKEEKGSLTASFYIPFIPVVTVLACYKQPFYASACIWRRHLSQRLTKRVQLPPKD
jgi:hypothetical protein